MQDHDRESRRRTGIRDGFVMLASAVVLSPFLFLLVDLVPSRENTSLDELPYMAFTAALIALGVAGVARIGHALLAEKRNPELSSPRAPGYLHPFGRTGQRSLSVEPQGAQPIQRDTPV